MPAAKDGCVKPAQGPIGAPGVEAAESAGTTEEVVSKVMARVGYPAPDFEVSAFVDGGFQNVKLSDHKGKWVVLCFYPGDFTFV